MPEADDLHTRVAEAFGIYGTSPTCHLSALARLEGYRPERLEQALEVDRSLVRVRVMRRSVYMLGHEQLLVALAGTRREVLKAFDTPSRKVNADFRAFARDVEAALADGPLPSAEIRSRVDPDKSLGYGFNILMGRMTAECRIVRATTTGSWRSDRLTYARWEDWLPGLDPQTLSEEEGKRRLAEEYVAAYGPVELDDLAWWAGWTKKDTRAAADGLDLTRVGRAPARLAGVKMLPVWDVLMVAYKNRERLLAPEHAPFVYDRFGNATSVVLDGGSVVGVWDLGRSDDPLAVRVAPLGRWPKRRWDGLEREVRRIGEMLDSSKVEVIRRPKPVDLLEAPRNRFLSPLKDDG